ncbi:MAG: hypothetical protein KDC35_08600 [Acidobacteria bacterium]|nr:hypothetical protein [Acidobacteriota bacterium]
MALMQAVICLQAGESVASPELESSFRLLLEGQADPVLAGAFLSLLIRNGLTSHELLAFRTVAAPFIDSVPYDGEVVSISDLGTWERHSFHVYTAVSFVVAACGIDVINLMLRTSRKSCSRFEILEDLQIPINRSLQKPSKTGIAFVDAEAAFPALAPLRALTEPLGHPNFLSIALPLLHPIQNIAHLIAVSKEEETELYGESFLPLGSQGLFVYGEDQTAEVSLTTRTKITSLIDGEMESTIFDPRRVGFTWTSLDQLEAEGDQANLFHRILRDREQSVYSDLVVLNAGFAIQAVRQQNSIEECLDQALQAIQSGKAWEVLNRHAIKPSAD